MAAGARRRRDDLGRRRRADRRRSSSRRTGARGDMARPRPRRTGDGDDPPVDAGRSVGRVPPPRGAGRRHRSRAERRCLRRSGCPPAHNRRIGRRAAGRGDVARTVVAASGSVERPRRGRSLAVGRRAHPGRRRLRAPDASGPPHRVGFRCGSPHVFRRAHGRTPAGASRLDVCHRGGRGAARAASRGTPHPRSDPRADRRCGDDVADGRAPSRTRSARAERSPRVVAAGRCLGRRARGGRHGGGDRVRGVGRVLDRTDGGDRPLSQGLAEPRVEVRGEWPGTRVEVSFRHPFFPAGRLRRTLRVFDAAGRFSPPLYASVHLMEDLATSRLPPIEAAVDGILDI